MNNPVLDMSYMYELSASEPQYIYDIVNIYLDTTPNGIAELETMIRDGSSLTIIYKQAHFLKSSTSIIKVRDVYEDISVITELAKNGIDDREKMLEKMANINKNMAAAIPLLKEELVKHSALVKKS